MWTVEKIKELCKEYCGRCNVDFDSPVIINGRLTRTLGRCFCIQTKYGWQPTKIEISRQLLETATDESIKEVIAHECAHYVSCFITKENHGHDSTFRFYCNKIGTGNCKAVYNNLQRTVPKEKVYKYTGYCSCCGKLVITRSRACKITQNPKLYKTACCEAEIKIYQNW